MNYKKYFPIFKTNKDLCYLDSAATSLKLGEVIKCECEFIQNNGTNPHSGGYDLSYQAETDIEIVRNRIGKYLNSPTSSNIVFTYGTTDSLNLVINGLENIIAGGDEIINSPLDHHSFLLPVQSLCQKTGAKNIFMRLHNGKITLKSFLDAVTEKTKVLCLTHVSNAFGVVAPIKSIIEEAHKRGIIVIVDAAQSIPHMRIDVSDIDVDFLAFSMHKIFGPFGVGVLYGKSEMLKMITPSRVGGGMIYTYDKAGSLFKEIPYIFEGGTPNVAGIVASKAAIDFMDNLHLEQAEKRVVALAKLAIKGLSHLDDVIVYNNGECGIVNFNISGVHSHDAQGYLNTKNICIRAGHHCAQLAMKEKSIKTSLRASFSIYNDSNDVDKLIVAIKDTIEFFRSK